MANNAPTKIKSFYQTKLCFGPTSASDKKLSQRPEKRQLQVIDENARHITQGQSSKSSHAPPCPSEKCEPAIRRVPCTSVNSTTMQRCNFKFCISCLDSIYNEKVCETQLGSWICPICRGTCVCDECKRSKKRTPDIREKMQLSFKKAEPINPPKMQPITLLYSEEELWVRLQIREFVFHFGRYFGMDDTRFTTNLQNVQGKWRTKRLAAHIAIQLVRKAKEFALDAFGKVEHNARISQLGRDIYKSWCDYYRIDEDGGLETIVETQGLNTEQWEDIIELLQAADFKVPIIEGRRTAFNELQLVQLMCDMLLLDSSLRKALAEENKELKAIEAALRKERADFEMEELKAKRRRIDNPKEAQALDGQLKKERVALERKRLCYMMDMLRSSKRIAPSWHDHDGNEYWLFNDLVGSNNSSDSTRNTEPYWAFGVIVIGEGGWFYIQGEQELMQLRRWADNASTFKTQLTNRLQYLATLERLSQML